MNCSAGQLASRVPYPREQIRQFFNGLHLIEPGLTDLSEWQTSTLHHELGPPRFASKPGSPPSRDRSLGRADRRNASSGQCHHRSHPLPSRRPMNNQPRLAHAHRLGTRLRASAALSRGELTTRAAGHFGPVGLPRY